MTTATATAATSPPATEIATTRRKVEVEVHTAESLAELIGLSPFLVRGVTPPHATRLGDDYLVIAEHADRLRAIRTGTPVERVYRRENEIDARRAAELQRPIDEIIRKADARCAAEKAERDAAAKAWSDAFRAREARRNGQETVDDKGQRRNAVGDRVV